MRLHEIESPVLVEPNFNQQSTPPSLVPAADVVRLRKVCLLIIIVLSTMFGGLKALGQFADFSTYTSPTTPVSWDTPYGNMEVTFNITIDPGTLTLAVNPLAIGQTLEPVDNPTFTTRYPMSSYEMLTVGDFGDPLTFPVTETLVLHYSQPVNFQNDLIFSDIGGAGDGFDGPFIGTIAATLGGVPVSTSTWQFTAFDDTSPIDPVSFSWDASAGQFQVDTFVSSTAGILSSDSNTPFDTLTITYQTCSWDLYGIAQYAYPVPEPSSWNLLWMGLLSMYCARMRLTRLRGRRVQQTGTANRG